LRNPEKAEVVTTTTNSIFTRKEHAMNTVNPQITDAVTQANVKVLADAPAMAMGAIYQSIAHSVGILLENAVTAQQQQSIIAQAAATQGVVQIYSLDAASDSAATAKIAQTGVADNLTSLLAALNTLKPAGRKANAVAETVPAAETPAAELVQGIANQIEAAVEFSNDAVLGNVHDFVSGLDEIVAAMANAVDAMNRVGHDNLLRILQNAAISATTAAMIREPEKAKEYGEVLQLIKQLV
jgi:Killing trait